MTCVGFIGFGLIGGSLAKAMKASGHNYKISAFSRSGSGLTAALDDGTIDKVATSLCELFPADIIFICTPVGAVANILSDLKKYVSSDCIITDVGSVKGYIHKCAKQEGLSDIFVGGHPMAGSEMTSYSNSYASLFKNRPYILTKSPDFCGNAKYEAKVGILKNIVSEISANPLIMTPDTHDLAVAGASHLPHLASAGLVKTLIDNDTKNHDMKNCISTGFLDTTRIAASSPDIWQQICETNRDCISKILESYIDLLNNINTELKEEADLKSIYDLFEEARNFRNSLTVKN